VSASSRFWRRVSPSILLWCPLKTPTGIMRGTYQMVRSSDGNRFDIEIAPFALRARYPLH